MFANNDAALLDEVVMTVVEVLWCVVVEFFLCFNWLGVVVVWLVWFWCSRLGLVLWFHSEVNSKTWRRNGDQKVVCRLTCWRWVRSALLHTTQQFSCLVVFSVVKLQAEVEQLNARPQTSLGRSFLSSKRKLVKSRGCKSCGRIFYCNEGHQILSKICGLRTEFNACNSRYLHSKISLVPGRDTLRVCVKCEICSLFIFLFLLCTGLFHSLHCV